MRELYLFSVVVKEVSFVLFMFLSFNSCVVECV